jgi:hypothetical protein
MCSNKKKVAQEGVHTHANMVHGTSLCVSEDSVSQRLQPITTASESPGDAMDLASSQKRSAALKSAVRHSQKAQRSLKQKLTQELRQESRETQMRMDVAFVLLVRQNGDITRSLEYLKQVGHRISNAESESPQEQLEQRFLRTPLPEMQPILEGGGPLKRKAFTIADRWQEEHSVFSWIVAQNVNQGVAPSSRMVEKHLSDNHVDKKEDRDCRRRGKTWAASKKWLQRFRRRWSLCRGSFSGREKIPLDSMREKVVKDQGMGHPCVLKIQ